jgi:hypothetical protein
MPGLAPLHCGYRQAVFFDWLKCSNCETIVDESTPLDYFDFLIHRNVSIMPHTHHEIVFGHNLTS